MYGADAVLGSVIVPSGWLDNLLALAKYETVAKYW